MKLDILPDTRTRRFLLEQDLENRILHGLSLEWENALSMLSPALAPGLKKPLFSLKEGQRSLASWNPLNREIAFSRSFVKNYPWDAVREVLIHEMAHQYTHEVLNCHHETPHGNSFHEACRILRANPNASGEYRPLTDRLSDPDLSSEDKILVKIKKLLALGKSSNPHEAEAALVKAQSLIDRFNVDIHKKGHPPSFVSTFVGKPALRRFKEDYLLARLLVDHYLVFGIWVSAYVLEKGKMGRVFEITGRPENVKTASYVHDFIVNQTHMAWEVYNSDKTFNRYRKSDFAFGLIEGFSKGLIQEKTSRTDTDQTHLPMKIGEALLIEYTARKYPRTRRFTRQACNIDPSVMNKGKSVGEKLVLSPGIEKGRDKSQKRLPYHEIKSS